MLSMANSPLATSALVSKCVFFAMIDTKIVKELCFLDSSRDGFAVVRFTVHWGRENFFWRA